jgi:hypothetical protein
MPPLVEFWTTPRRGTAACASSLRSADQLRNAAHVRSSPRPRWTAACRPPYQNKKRNTGPIRATARFPPSTAHPSIPNLRPPPSPPAHNPRGFFGALEATCRALLAGGAPPPAGDGVRRGSRARARFSARRSCARRCGSRRIRCRACCAAPHVDGRRSRRTGLASRRC